MYIIKVAKIYIALRSVCDKEGGRLRQYFISVYAQAFQRKNYGDDILQRNYVQIVSLID